MSTEIQVVRGESLRRQTELSNNYAMKNGLTIEPIPFKDLGVSAFHGDQVELGALGRFLKAVESGAIDKGSYLLVESLDRISRQTILDAQTLFLQIINADIVLVTLIDEMVYSRATMQGANALGTLVYSLSIMQRANEESETKSRRLKSSWQNKRANLDKKKATAMAPYWLKLRADRTGFDVDEDRAAIVKKIFEDSRDGIGFTKIVKRLNQTVPHWGRSDGWRGSYIKKILDSQSTIGIFQPTAMINGVRTRLDPVPDYYPRIISDDLFFSARASRNSRKTKGGRRGVAYTNLFTTMAKCGYCGASITLLNKGSRSNQRHLRCDAAVRSHGPCKAGSWGYQDFETNFLSLVCEIDIAQFVDSDLEKSKLTELKIKRASIGSELDLSSSRFENLTTSLADLVASAQRAVISQVNLLASKIDQLKASKIEIESEIHSLEARSKTVAEHQDTSRRLISEFKSMDGEALYELRAKLAQLLRESIEKIVIFSDGMPSDEKSVRSGLASAGYEADRIDAYMESVRKQSKLHAKKNRAYGVYFIGGDYRVIKPDAADPTLYELMSEGGHDKAAISFFAPNSTLSKFSGGHEIFLHAPTDSLKK